MLAITINKKQELIIQLLYIDEIIGEIYPTSASKITREIKGLIVPTENYYNYRSSINKYTEIFDISNSTNQIDKALDNMLKTEYKEIEKFYSKIVIKIDGDLISTEKSTIRIIDNLIRTGNGAPVISIESWNLDTKSLKEEIQIYKSEYKYPSTPKNIITIEKNGKIVLEY